MRFLTFCFCLFTLSSQAQFTKYVNPFIGTGGTGHTFPGATTPFAMVQLSPDTRVDGSWEGCSGYHYNDSIIYGFSHTHLSGTGCSDYGDIAFMPYFSKTENFDYVKNNLLQAKFSHKNEKASAGYYSVVLDDIPVKVELTATTRTGFQRYTFLEDGYGYIVLNLKHRDELLEGSIHKLNNVYSGIRRSKAWAKNQELYYGTELDFRFVGTDILPFGDPYAKEEIIKDGSNDTKLIIQFKAYKGLSILIKTGISTVDEDAALNNLKVENPSWNFNKIKQQANDSWEKELRKIEVSEAKVPSPLERVRERLFTFYTAMYHCMIHPSIMNDVDGRYKGRDGKIHKAEGFNYYTVFSLWDTHRALHPLLNIIDKKRSHDFVITFLNQYEQSGRLPMWELWNNETDCMIGFHSVSVILDAYRKQVISKTELQQLWPAVKAEAMSNRFGLDKFREKGYLSVEDESESVSKTLEYSYDMWCVSEIATELDLKEDEKYFRKYEVAWQELENNENGFMQPRKNGNWLQNFNPYEVNNNYTEANAWQYSYYHPQTNFSLGSIDKIFIAENKTQGRVQADITGLIGQYAHGNEPSHNYIYLLKSNLRLKYLKYVYDNFYTNKPDGLIGNEDCGQMSAWYVMSALGFYQTCPGNNNFTLGLPIFSQAVIHLDSDIKMNYNFNLNELKDLSIYNKKYLNLMVKFDNAEKTREDIAIKEKLKIMASQRGLINLTFDDSIMSKTNKRSSFNRFSYENLVIRDTNLITYNIDTNKYINFGGCWPENLLIPAPTIAINQVGSFRDSALITIKSPIHEYLKSAMNESIIEPKSNLIFYSINNQEYKKYNKPFFINQNATIKAFINNFSDTSNLSIAHFYKRPHNYSIQLNCKYNKQYTADGDDGIIDGQYGETDWKKGGWQGYQSQDFEAVIDMKDVKQFAEISANFLQDTRSWILFPTKVEFYISNDSINFKLAETIENTISPQDYTVQTKKFTNSKTDKCRYIKVKAHNYGKLPEWHAGKGDDAFIFIDEIEIK